MARWKIQVYVLWTSLIPWKKALSLLTPKGKIENEFGSRYSPGVGFRGGAGGRRPFWSLFGQEDGFGEDSDERKAVVIGGGPVGLATALMLASPPHKYDVSIIESSSEDMLSSYDPTKAFLYNVNFRGQTFTSHFPQLQRLLQQRGSSQDTSTTGRTLMIVPPDPQQPVLSKVLYGQQAKPDNNNPANNPADKSANNPDNNPANNPANKSVEKKKPASFWIPRHEFIGILLETVRQHNQQALGGTIHIHSSQQCLAVRPAAGDATSGRQDRLQVLVASTKTSPSNEQPKQQQQLLSQAIPHYAQLVIGADGIHSRVRHCLAESCASNFLSAGYHYQPRTFIPRQWKSPASGLRIKVLQFPSKFTIPNNYHDNQYHDNKNDNNHDDIIVTNSEQLIAIRSSKTNSKDYLNLGLLPLKDNNAMRPTNIITRPDHNVWTYNNGTSMKHYFDQQYPRFQFASSNNDKNNKNKPLVTISDDEWDRFAKANGTHFPPCQYSPGAAISSPTNLCGIALVGDALHAYPPDIGQGINAGLADVVALDRALRGLPCIPSKKYRRQLFHGQLNSTELISKEYDDNNNNNKETMKLSNNTRNHGIKYPMIGKALQQYQKHRPKESHALIRLSRFGSPYQYRQPHTIDRIGRTLWQANVAFRMILNKLSGGILPPPCIIYMSRGDLTFREVMRRADTFTIGLWSFIAYWFGKLIWKMIHS